MSSPNNKHPGVGTAISEILAGFGIFYTPSCSCEKKAAEWDKLGIEWAKENINEMTEVLMKNMGDHPSFIAKFSSFLAQSSYVGEVFYRMVFKNIINRAIAHVESLNGDKTET